MASQLTIRSFIFSNTFFNFHIRNMPTTGCNYALSGQLILDLRIQDQWKNTGTNLVEAL